MYVLEKSKDFNFFKKFDYLLFLAVIILSIVGAFVVSSAVNPMNNGKRIIIVHVGAIIVGIVVSIIISLIDYKDYRTLGIFFYITTGLLVYVLFAGTGDQLGSRSWIDLGFITFQPADLAKITYILLASVFLERIYDDQKNKKANIFKFLIYSAIPIGLIILQKDFGTALVFIFIFFVLVFICGIAYKYLVIMATAFLLSTPFVWFFLLNDNRRKRILVFLNPELDPLDAGYNVIRSKLAIGSGQIYGKGLYKGIQTQNQSVPVSESDFIFSVVGEELGFIGAIIVIVLICIILMRCLYIARKSRDSYGMFVASGIAAMWAFHSMENIGMSVGVLPVTGIPLPFVSAGGSYMVTCYVAVGIVLSISMRRKKEIFNSSD
ncbi:rod shape-determining protein RodA [Acetivibrio clariflavus]|uniref:Rod shape-determining protein RodA n=1 Tax=Acetivibrio clariflavus (strain DSM 19732 / NBRC 101661 / EBR45) TaxID=720554 RepID=G8LZ60_ACECE|nr:rod shape-determining protein RodA [Acetivibrio clariflavus]AEV69004.1 rod shape-determining protein RodA [Acetivibrio clariflavus DSM 19732]